MDRINRIKKCKESPQFLINPIYHVNHVNIVNPVPKIKNCILNLKEKKFFSNAKSGIKMSSIPKECWTMILVYYPNSGRKERHTFAAVYLVIFTSS